MCQPCVEIELTRSGNEKEMQAICCADSTTFQYGDGISAKSVGVVWPCVAEMFIQPTSGSSTSANPGDGLLFVIAIITTFTGSCILSGLAMIYVYKTLPTIANRESAYEYMGDRPPRIPQQHPILRLIEDLPVDTSSTIYEAPIAAPRQGPLVLDAFEVTVHHSNDSESIYEAIQFQAISPGSSYETALYAAGINRRARAATD